jgi:hypothetical protein
MKKAAVESPADYLSTLPEPRRSQLAQLHAFIQKTIPRLRPQMHAGMIGYGMYHYVYATGREGDWPVVALSSRAQHISLYICAVDSGGYLAEQSKHLLPKASIGKSCIRFKRVEDVDLGVIKDLLKRAEKWFQAQPKPAPAPPKSARRKSPGKRKLAGD